MPLTIGSNIASLQAQLRLGEATTRLESVYERLSSGQRINRASDDAAGLAIADGLRTSARVQTQAIRNTNDGISALNIMTGTLDQQSQLLMRLSELAEQSANGTYSYGQRGALEGEYRQLVKEFGRLGDTTLFNGLALLSAGIGGNSSSFNLQVGSNGSINSLLSLSSGRSGTMMGSIVADGLDNDWGGGDMSELNFQTSGNIIRTEITDSLGQKHKIFLAVNGVLASSVNFRVFGLSNEAGGTFTTDGSVEELGDFGVSLNLSSGSITGSLTGTTNVFLNGATANLNIDMRGIQLLRPPGVGGSAGALPISTSATLLEASGVETQESARYAIEFAKSRLDSLNALRGTLGAVQSRLNSAKSLTEVTRENYLGAESRIRDADIAEESAQLIATQITQQAATRVLQSANLQPQIALTLLRSR